MFRTNFAAMGSIVMLCVSLILWVLVFTITCDNNFMSSPAARHKVLAVATLAFSTFMMGLCIGLACVLYAWLMIS